MNISEERRNEIIENAKKKRFSQLDPYEIELLGYRLIDSGYADSKDDYEYLKTIKYKGCKVVRVRTDTKGLINYIVYKKEDWAVRQKG